MTEHVWKVGDSLSQLAVTNGFADWRRIWDHAANNLIRFLRGTPDNLEVGDVVQIPDRTRGKDIAPTANETKFIRLGLPVASVHIVDDGGRPGDEFVRRVATLEVSNHITSKHLPPRHLKASPDRDNFKVEVVDSGESGNRIPANRTVVEALRPKLLANGDFQRDTARNIQYTAFTPPRRITGGVDLRRVPGTNKFRSRYLRLVMDWEDFRIRNGQTLLTDHDPTDLRVEILDQKVRVTYTSALAEPLRAEADVGRGERRFRLTMQIVRTIPGGALVGGLSIAEVQRHVAKWVRRTYAQANMAPKLVNFPALLPGTPAAAVRTVASVVGVREVDPPENLVSIFNRNRNTARANERIHFRVRAARKNVSVDYTTTAAGGDRTPQEIANRCATQLRKGGFTVTVAPNPLMTSLAQSCDLLILDPAGQRVTISGEKTRPGGARTRIGVGRLKPRRPTDLPNSSANWSVGTRDVRVLARNYRSGANRIDCFIIDRFRRSDSATGAAWPRLHNRAAALRSTHPVLGIVLVDARVAHAANGIAHAAPEKDVHTIAHEYGHVLIDMAEHLKGRRYWNQLMSIVGSSPDHYHGVRASKRLADWTLSYRDKASEQIVTNATTGRQRVKKFVGGIRDDLNPTQRVRNQEFGTYGQNW